MSAPVLTERLAGRIDLRALHAAAPTRYPFLLESAAGQHARTGCYDVLFAVAPEESTPVEQGFLAGLDADFAALRVTEQAAAALPFIGGWFVYLGYELAQQIEPRLRLPRCHGLSAQWPVAFAVRCRSAVIYDHLRAETWLITEADQPQSAQALARLHSDVVQAPPASASIELPSLVTLTEAPSDEFLQGVARIQEYIRAGDVFQINLARAWQGRFQSQVDPLTLYRKLCKVNPAPFAALARWRGSALVSSSPERLFSLRDGQIETRPIAGTRPRGRLLERERAALLAHPKERAEHVMLIDLERNDLGRVCEPGSVRVDEFMSLESYAHVHHIVSNLRGRLRAGWTPAQVIRALFPGGTITGCPKIRSMEIIAELEGAGRGPYTGAVGYLDRRGRMDFNILIRSLWLQDDQFEFRTGAGIVADSIPVRELSETRAKARGLLRALGSET
ncbi:MAG: aminodeoxychorismate synthase component I [Nevskiales bacterium]